VFWGDRKISVSTLSQNAFAPNLRLRIGLSVFLSFLSFLMSHGNLFEAAVNLAQFPEDRDKENRNYEQQELNAHFLAFGSQGIVKRSGISTTVFPQERYLKGLLKLRPKGYFPFGLPASTKTVRISKVLPRGILGPPRLADPDSTGQSSRNHTYLPTLGNGVRRASEPGNSGEC
jgi:hypothetical protein